MKTLAFFSQKGGSGKTTLAIHAAVAALDGGQSVALIDSDPQQSSASWGKTRQREVPVVAKASASNIDQALDAARAEAVDLCLIDCPPHAMAGVAHLIEVSDFVVIPCQPSALDVAAAGRAVDMVQAAGKRFAFVINRAPWRAPENRETVETLAQLGPVCPVLISERRAYARALTGGQAVSEFESGGKAAMEIGAFWSWLTTQL